MSDDIHAVERRRLAHQQLDDFLDSREKLFESAQDDRSREGWARVLLHNVAGLASFFAGSDLIDAALTPWAGDESRETTLGRIIERLNIASSLFGGSDIRDPASFNAVAREVMAIRGGDQPVLFARREGRKRDYRLAYLRLRAIEWDAWLEGRGIEPADRHAKIASAFVQEWDTISKWKKLVSPVLGQQVVEQSVRRARHSAEHSLCLPPHRSVDDWLLHLKEDAEAFKVELIQCRMKTK